MKTIIYLFAFGLSLLASIATASPWIDNPGTTNSTWKIGTLTLTDSGGSLSLTSITFANGEKISGAVDGQVLFTRSDAGTLTLNAADNNAVCDVVLRAGSTGALQLGHAENTSVTIATDSTGTAELVVPNDSISLTTETDGNYVASVATTAPLTGGAAGSEGATLTVAITADGIDFTQLADTLTLDASTAFTVPTAMGLTFVKTFGDGIAENVVAINPSGLDTAGATTNQVGLLITNQNTAQAVDALLKLDNLDSDGGAGDVPAAISLANSGRFTNFLNLDGTLISVAEAQALDSGITLSTETNGNFVQTITTSAITGLTGGAAGSEATDITLGLDRTATIGADPAIVAGGWVPSTTGIIFEGGSADGIETLISVNDPTAVDKTINFPNADGTVAVSATSPVSLSALGAIGITADAIAFADIADALTPEAGTSIVGADTVGADPQLPANSIGFGTTGLIFEGTTGGAGNAFEGLLTCTDPTGDNTWTLPNASGTVAVSASAPISLSAVGDIGVTADAIDFTHIADALTPEAGTSIVGADTVGGNPQLPNNAVGFGTTGLIFEGATGGAGDAFEGLLTVTDPTGDNTWTLPNVSGSIVTTGDTGTVTATMIANTTRVIPIGINGVSTVTTGLPLDASGADAEPDYLAPSAGIYTITWDSTGGSVDTAYVEKTFIVPNDWVSGLTIKVQLDQSGATGANVEALDCEVAIQPADGSAYNANFTVTAATNLANTTNLQTISFDHSAALNLAAGRTVIVQFAQTNAACDDAVRVYNVWAEYTANN